MPDQIPERPQTLTELRALSDDQVVALHDLEFATTTKSAGLYQRELERRASEREAVALNALAKEANDLARDSNRFARIAIAIAVLALVVSLVVALYTLTH